METHANAARIEHPASNHLLKSMKKGDLQSYQSHGFGSGALIRINNCSQKDPKQSECF